MTIISKPAPTPVAAWTVEALDLIDGTAHDRVLVYGALPPEGGDLDLLARPEDVTAIRTALTAAGFAQAGYMLARFRNGTCEMVELTPADVWGLPPRELEALFAQAQPIEGKDHLARPSTHHALLIRARKVAQRRGALQKQMRKRALWDGDPDAWRRAAAHAPAWQARHALALLERAREGNGMGDSAVPPLVWWRALAEQWHARDARDMRGRWRMVRAVLPHVRRTHVVTFSGLDGSGKSTQARMLRDALRAAGQDADVIWVGIGTNRSLGWIKAPVKRALRVLPRAGPLKELVGRARSRTDGKPTPLAEPGNRERQHGLAFRVVTQIWLMVMALTNVYTTRKVVLRAFGRGRVIIFDRYTLDSAVRLRHWYGDSLVARLAIGLTKLLAKRPVRAFFLDVPARIAFDRKPEWEMSDFASRALLYDEEYARLGVYRLDGTRPKDALSAEIAAEVWSALHEQQH